MPLSTQFEREFSAIALRTLTPLSLPAPTGVFGATPVVESPAVYWQSKADPVAYWAIGTAQVAQSDTDPLGVMDVVDHWLTQHPDVRVLGGTMFPTRRPVANWPGFYKAHYWVPRLVWAYNTHTQQSVGLRAWVWLESEAQRAEQLTWFRRVVATLAEIGVPEDLRRMTLDESMPNQAAFKACVSAITEQVEASASLQKVVLARRFDAHLSQAVSPMTLFHRLRASEPDAHHICWQITPDTGFMVVSPERLVSRKGSAVMMDAIAGTRPRASTPEADAQLAAALMQDPKDQHEHGVVFQYTSDRLQRLCSQVEHDATYSILKQRYVQHLYQRIWGQLTDETGVNRRLIETVFPTPAVAGHPFSEALDMIDSAEPFSRGLYGGVLGCITPTTSEYVVGIRALHQQGKLVSIYTGSGLVSGSQPETEWQEHEAKMATVLAPLMGMGSKSSGLSV